MARCASSGQAQSQNVFGCRVSTSDVKTPLHDAAHDLPNVQKEDATLLNV